MARRIVTTDLGIAAANADSTRGPAPLGRRYSGVAVLTFSWLMSLIGLPTFGADKDAPPRVRQQLFNDRLCPSAEELLHGRPSDRVVLNNGNVYDCEPITPRPNTVAKMQAAFDEHVKKNKPKSEEERERFRKERERMIRLPLTLIDNSDDPEYVIKFEHIYEITHHEDKMLRRASLEMEAGHLAVAYELLLALQRRYPNWPEFDRHLQRLLWIDSEAKSKANDDFAALRLLEELAESNPNYTGLSNRLGEVTQRLVRTSLQAEDYRAARHYLSRLARRDAQHPVRLTLVQEIQELALRRLEEARGLFSQSQFVSANRVIKQAARIWPETPGLREAFREITDRQQILRVGVLRLPDEGGQYPLTLPEDIRQRQLTEIPLFEPQRLDENGCRFASTWFDQWEPRDLGRDVRMTLRRQRGEWEARPLLTAPIIRDDLARQLDRRDSRFNERLAALVERVSAPAPDQLDLHLRQFPVRFEAALAFPIPTTTSVMELNPDLEPAVSLDGFQQRFCVSNRSESTITYRRVRPQPATARSRYVAQIEESKCADWPELRRRFLRGDFDVLPRVEWADLADFRADGRFFVVPYALPMTHCLRFHPRSLLWKNGTLRRALAHGLPREELLAKELLHGADPQLGRLVDSPIHFNSALYYRVNKPLEYDPYLSSALALTAKKEFSQQLPALRFYCPPSPTLERVALAMVEHWRRIGLTVELNPQPAPPSDEQAPWDVVLEQTRMLEPVTELWPLLTAPRGTEIAALDPFSPLIRRKLLDIENATSWREAQTAVHEFTADLHADYRWVPLWEVDEFLVAWKHVLNIPDRPLHSYHDVERWRVQASFANE